VLTPFQDRITQAEVGRKRCQPTVDEYQLAGLLRSLKTDGSAFKFGLAPCTMAIRATCVLSFRPQNLMTGAVLLEDTITATGHGTARIKGRDSALSTTARPGSRISPFW
jgi:hypothetical protein